MCTERPLVSIVIPVYNHKQWFIIALRSALRQTYENIEVIVVDDGSEEKIFDNKIVADRRIRYFRNTNHGVAYSRNFGMRQAKGKYIAFLDGDDIWKKDKLEIQIKEMESKDAVWSQHSYYYYDNSTKRVTNRIDTYKYRTNTARVIYCSFQVQTSCFVVRRNDVLERGILFDEKKTFGEDDVFYQEMIKLFPLLCINECLSYFRVKATNSGLNVNKQISNRIQIWNSNKDDSYFRDNTTFYVRFAYWLCTLIGKFSDDYRMVKSIMYFFPYLILKIETKRLCRG